MVYIGVRDQNEIVRIPFKLKSFNNFILIETLGLQNLGTKIFV